MCVDSDFYNPSPVLIYAVSILQTNLRLWKDACMLIQVVSFTNHWITVNRMIDLDLVDENVIVSVLFKRS